jgi:DegV family protein with EDD domain
MKFKIVSDSSSNIFFVEGANYVTVPMKVIAEKEYVDTPDLDLAAMVEDLKNHKGKSGSSCPNVQEWLDAFGEDADAIFGLTISRNLSGSYNSAKQAAETYMDENPGKKAYVFDSFSAGPEMAMMAEKVAEYAAAGCDFDTVVEKVEAYQNQVHTLFSLESLTNLARNGRVNPAVAKIAGVLGIRMVGCASEVGTLQPLHKCRGEKKALETIFKEMVERGFEGGRARIAHCFNPDAAASLKETILAAFPKSDIFIEPATALCSFYAEQGGLLVGFESV